MLRKVTGLKPFKRFGFTDELGHVVIPATFDDVFVNEFFILVKNGKNWGSVTDFSSFENVNYEFEDVLVFEDVLWFKQSGEWGAKNVDNEILVEPRFKSIVLLPNSRVIEGVSREFSTEYFTTLGNSISIDTEFLSVGNFYNGYAMADGFSNDNTIHKFFVLNSRGVVVQWKIFDDANECRLFLRELRNDFVWSCRA